MGLLHQTARSNTKNSPLKFAHQELKPFVKPRMLSLNQSNTNKFARKSPASTALTE